MRTIFAATLLAAAVALPAHAQEKAKMSPAELAFGQKLGRVLEEWRNCAQSPHCDLSGPVPFLSAPIRTASVPLPRPDPRKA